MAQRIVETPFGPILIDDNPATVASPAPTKLELLADELGVDAEELRDHIRLSIAAARMDQNGNGSY